MAIEEILKKYRRNTEEMGDIIGNKKKTWTLF